MNIQLKQKIIGIIIIVVFAAIAIPILLSGAKGKSNTSETAQLDIQQGSSTTADVPIPSDTQVTIDNTSQPTQSETTLATANSIPSQQPAPIEASDSADLAQTAITTTATNDENTSTTIAIATPISPVASTDTTATATTIANNTNLAVQNSAPSQSLKQKESHITAHNSHKNTKTKNGINKHKLQAKTLANKSWLIDLGEYSNKKKAQNLVTKLKKDGYHAYAKKIKIKQKSLTMVLVGPVKNHEKTKKLAQKITKNFGIKAKVVTA